MDLRWTVGIGARARRLIATAVMVAAPASAQSAFAETNRTYNRVAFYFAAHEDDWQLFMNPSAFQDVVDARTKTVFVHMTAGDGGLGQGTAGRKHPYYLARESGAEMAIRFMADTRGYPHDKLEAPAAINGHALRRVSYRNTVAYFLRLPDGHGTGQGFEATGRQSLQRLALGEISSLVPIDGSTVYRGWTDLVSTLRAVLDHERGVSPTLELNVAELNANLNPNDHSDHRMTARAALDAVAGRPCVSRRHFVEYASAKLPENLDAQQRDMESSVVAVTAAGILALDHGSIWQAYYRTYLGRNYFREEPGTGRCDALVSDVAKAVGGRAGP